MTNRTPNRPFRVIRRQVGPELAWYQGNPGLRLVRQGGLDAADYLAAAVHGDVGDLV
jgi:hypothetical protein